MSNTSIAPSVGAASLAGVAAAMGLALAPAGSALALAANSPLIYPVPPLLKANQNAGTWTYSWSGLINGTTGQPTGVAPFQYEGGYAQITGTFGSGGSVQLEGSEDAVNWTILSPGAKTQAALVYLAAGEQPAHVRPHVTGGDSTTSLNVILKFSRVH